MDTNNHTTKIAIVCQGGGSHTAFTAGVLKRLLQEEEKSEKIETLRSLRTKSDIGADAIKWDLMN